MSPRRALTALGSRAAGSASQLLSAALVGQVLGVNALGALTSLTYVSTFGAQLFSYGVPGLALSDVSRTPGMRHKGLLIRAYLRHSLVPILAGAAVVALCFYAYASLAGEKRSSFALVDAGYFAPLFFCSFGYAFGKVVFESLKASGRPSRALFFEYSVPPLIVVVLVAASTATLVVSPQRYVMWSYTTGLFVAIGLGLWLIARNHAPATGTAKSFAMRRRELFMLWASASLGALSTAMPYLAWSLSGGATADEGHFAIAHRIVGVAATVQLAIAAAYAPALGLLRTRGDDARYYATLRNGTLWVVGPSAAFLAFALVFSSELFALFGSSHPPRPALEAMAILIAGRALSSVTGLAEMSFLVCGRAHADVVGLVVSIVAFVAVLLVREDHSLVGIALAFASSWVARSTVGLGFTYLFYLRDRQSR